METKENKLARRRKETERSDNEYAIEFKKFLKNVKVLELEKIIYIDGYHFYTSLKPIILKIRKSSKDICNIYYDTKCPNLPLTVSLYEDLIYEFLFNICRKFEADQKTELAKRFKANVASGFDYDMKEDDEKFMVSAHSFHTTVRQLKYEDGLIQKIPEYGMDNIATIKVFTGEFIDTEKLKINYESQIKYYEKHKNLVAVEKIKNNHRKLFNDTANRERENYGYFVQALKKLKRKTTFFNRKRSGVDYRSGITKTNFLVETNRGDKLTEEKGVDIKLTISALDDLADRTDPVSWTLVTSDTDFYPLVERIKDKGHPIILCSNDDTRINRFLRRAVEKGPINGKIERIEDHILENWRIPIPESKLTIDVGEYPWVVTDINVYIPRSWEKIIYERNPNMKDPISQLRHHMEYLSHAEFEEERFEAMREEYDFIK